MEHPVPARPLVVVCLLSLFAGRLGAEKACTTPEQSAEGKALYRTHCAACHGERGRGDGPMAEVLRVEPSDLSGLAEAPVERLMASIDGRAKVRGHGSSEMPVWGLSFREVGRDTSQEESVRDRLQAVVCYLRQLSDRSDS